MNPNLKPEVNLNLKPEVNLNLKPQVDLNLKPLVDPNLKPLLGLLAPRSKKNGSPGVPYPDANSRKCAATSFGSCIGMKWVRCGSGTSSALRNSRARSG